METYSENELINLMKAGCMPAFDEFYRRNWKPLFHIAYRAVNSDEEAKDLVQNVFVGFWNARHRLDAGKSVRAYLSTSLKNSIINFYRQEITRKEKIAYLLQHSEPVFTIEDTYSAKELSQRINGEIAQLPKKMQEIFILSRRQNLSVMEISEQLKIAPRTVKNQLSNALKILRVRLDIWR